MSRGSPRVPLSRAVLVVASIPLLSQCLTRYVDYGGTLPPLTIHGQLTLPNGDGVPEKEILLLAPHFMGWRDAALDLAAERIDSNTKRYDFARATTAGNGKFEYTFPEIFRLVGGKQTLFPFRHYSGAAPDEWNRVQVIVALAEKPHDFVLIRHFKGETSVYYLEPGNGEFLESPADQRSFGVSADIVRQSSHDTMELSLTLLNR